MAELADVLRLREVPDRTAVEPELADILERIDPPAPLQDPDLVDLLLMRATADQLSGAELSRQIGIHEAAWSRVRRRIDRFGVDACARIVARYPELREPAARYLTASYDPDALALLEEAGRLLRGLAKAS